MREMFVLFESASGYALFQRMDSDEIGQELDAVQMSTQEFGLFSKICHLKGFQPFASAENALECINQISEGVLGDSLRTFLEQNLPEVKPGKKPKWSLGLMDQKLAGAVAEELGYSCISNDAVLQFVRGIRLHLTAFLKDVKTADIEKAELGLGHAYSRAKVKFDANREDKMVVQSIALLDQLDKDLNTFAMRMREWYSWHFPELSRLVTDNVDYARVVGYIGDRVTLTEKQMGGLAELVGEETAAAVVEAARSSMGTDISAYDMEHVKAFAERVHRLGVFRAQLHTYLTAKMEGVAPNLTALIGEQVGARLISHAGSLTNLAKYPASTVQILGAEKALFRALKTRGNTPKYGLIFHSSFIGRAGQKNKGRISRYLANKCSIASRIDCFEETPTRMYGDKLREQVEERLKFYETGTVGQSNVSAMSTVAVKLLSESKAEGKEEAMVDDEGESEPEAASEKKKKKKEKKRKRSEAAAAAVASMRDEGDDDDDDDGGGGAAAAAAAVEVEVEDTPRQSKKKSKKRHSVAAAADVATPSTDKKKKKKKKKKDKTPQA